MKRVFPLLLAALAMLTLAGCPGGEDDGAAAEGATPNADGSPADGNGGGTAGNFRSGVDSGRAEDGSDEEK